MNLLHFTLILFQLIMAVFLISFHCSGYRLGSNIILARIRHITDPIVTPFRRLIPPTRFDYAQLVPPVIIALVIGYILSSSLVGSLIIGFGHILLNTWFQLFFYTMLITVIASWLQTDPRQPLMQICLACTEWLLSPIRRIIPPIAGLDFSPIIALLLIQYLNGAIGTLIQNILLGVQS